MLGASPSFPGLLPGSLPMPAAQAQFSHLAAMQAVAQQQQATQAIGQALHAQFHNNLAQGVPAAAEPSSQGSPPPQG